jgi:hypothetical protein
MEETLQTPKGYGYFRSGSTRLFKYNENKYPVGLADNPNINIPDSAFLQYHSTTQATKTYASESNRVAALTSHPGKFFEVRFQVSAQSSGCTAVCAG